MGTEEGDRCGRTHGDPTPCHGIIEWSRVDDCSCHVSPPCWRCTENTLECPECGWRSDE